MPQADNSEKYEAQAVVLVAVTIALGGRIMKRRWTSWAMGGTLLAASGCLIHPPYGHEYNSSVVPPVGAITHQNNLPPAQMLAEPGPGVGGPGPGVLMPEMMMPVMPQLSQVVFASPDGMTVAWDVSAPGAFDSEPLVVPGRFNFPQAAIYRLKLSNIPNRPGVELYPTLEIGPATPRTDAYLAHNAIPLQFTEEDFDQVQSGNFVTKVIYLPDAEFQELALAGVETLVSTRLDPGLDPIVEADRRGTIMSIIRMGNKDLEIPQPAGVSGAGGMMMGPNGPMPVGYNAAMPGGPCGPNGGGGLPPGFVAGVTAPQYGMPMSGTPIGLPGPPHIPLGTPAGLQTHTIKNNTKQHIPGPTRNVRVDVKQEPGFSYPKPAHKVRINERAYTAPTIFKQPLADRFDTDGQCGPGGNCPPGGGCPPGQ